MQRLILITAALALSACATTPKGKTAMPLVEEPGWRAVVSREDEQRLDHLPATWSSALASVPSRYRRTVTREGDLLSPDAARDHPSPPPGSYRCRLVKLGPGSGREPSVRSFPDYFCYIRGEKDNELSFSKQTGTELPGGWLHKDGDRRLVLTGARQRTPGDNSLAYGKEPARDVVGVIERIGPFRWRLVMPWRDAGTGLDVYELTPVPADQQAAEPRVTEVAPDKPLRTP
ncbi:MAG TPA: DUF4893 domain-containing protein [Sphingobium sp.]|uniref:DUF4893 domain-containing protein n=1 Tax=Sphingobium sp. TaxID=1912891 RepID=UPI002ED5282D